MEHDLLESLRRAHAEARMTGWDFSALKGRLIADDPWWDFEADCLDAMRYARAVADLEAAGMRVDQADEWSGQMRFTDVEALVIYLGYVPWDVPGFSVDEHLERLSELAASPGIAVTQRRFRIHATKP